MPLLLWGLFIIWVRSHESNITNVMKQRPAHPAIRPRAVSTSAVVTVTGANPQLPLNTEELLTPTNYGRFRASSVCGLVRKTAGGPGENMQAAGRRPEGSPRHLPANQNNLQLQGPFLQILLYHAGQLELTKMVNGLS